MRLFYRPQTGRPARVAWTLEEIGAGYETVALSAEECRSSAHRARQPLGRVPALELDDGHVLFESTAIVLALADRFPEAGLTGPIGSGRRDEVTAWAIFAMTELERSVLGASRFTDHVEAAFRDRQREAFAAAAEAVGTRLGDGEYLLGEALTAADIVLGGVLAIGVMTDLLGDAPANVVAWVARLHARPAYAAALERTESLMPRP